MESIKTLYESIKKSIQSGNLQEAKGQIQKVSAESSSTLKQVLTQKDIEGYSLIFHAALHSSEDFCLEMVDYLMTKGSDIKDHDINKQTIIYYISKDGKDRLLKKMLVEGYNLNENDYSSQTPLFYAAKEGHLQVAKQLIEYGCNVNHKDSNGQTCLFYAAGSGHLEMCKFLANKGCNVLHQDNRRVKAINFARNKGHSRVVEYLSQFKMESKRIKEEKKRQNSSVSEVKKKKREQVTNEYSLVYCSEDGQVVQLDLSQIKEFIEASEDNRKLIELMQSPEQLDYETDLPVSDRRFEKAATKILNYFWKLEYAIYFHEPVDYVRLNLQDYPKIVKYPMDFGTIKKKLAYNAYLDEEEFRSDMNLVFDNCILYNGMESPHGKIAMEMKLEFNATYLKELYNGGAASSGISALY